VRFEQLLADARVLAGAARTDGRRRMLGICGAPGAGKSTLANRLGEHLRGQAVVVGMDGFHYAQRELARLGRAERKGAPDTFDAAGYLALLHRLRQADGETVYVPEFRRDLEEPVGSAVPVPPDLPLVITEGNYLLLDDPPWHRVREALDAVWFLAPPEEQRVDRLIGRHREFGRSAQEAAERAYGSDGANARLVAASAVHADLVIETYC
jgi:pantothenate kinase